MRVWQTRNSVNPYIVTLNDENIPPILSSSLRAALNTEEIEGEGLTKEEMVFLRGKQIEIGHLTK